MKTFTTENVTSSTEFKKQVRNVLIGTQARYKQIQQLLMIALAEASKQNDKGKVSNNLSWFDYILDTAESTKGISGRRIGTYIREVLCCKTVTITMKKDKKTKAVTHTTKKSIDTKGAIKYNNTPKDTWFEYQAKKESTNKIDDATRFANAIKKAKGELTKGQFIQALLTNVTADELIQMLADLEQENQTVAKESKAKANTKAKFEPNH